MGSVPYWPFKSRTRPQSPLSRRIRAGRPVRAERRFRAQPEPLPRVSTPSFCAFCTSPVSGGNKPREIAGSERGR